LNPVSRLTKALSGAVGSAQRRTGHGLGAGAV